MIAQFPPHKGSTRDLAPVTDFRMRRARRHPIQAIGSDRESAIREIGPWAMKQGAAAR
jgi:hypothetical protein